MKSRIAGVGTLLFVFFLCGVSFVVGRKSVDTHKPVARVMHEMNELDRLQLETVNQK